MRKAGIASRPVQPQPVEEPSPEEPPVEEAPQPEPEPEPEPELQGPMGLYYKDRKAVSLQQFLQRWNLLCGNIGRGTAPGSHSLSKMCGIIHIFIHSAFHIKTGPL